MSLAELQSKAIVRRRELVKEAGLERVPPSEFIKRKGLIGLYNIGNTCYINASLQCLSHCADLTKFLLGGGWEDQVNPVNSIGTEGELLVEYVKLLHRLWSSNQTVVAIKPIDFKERLEKEN